MKQAPESLRLCGNSVVTAVNAIDDRFIVETADGEIFDCTYPPIAATGFYSALKPVQHLFEWEASIPQFTEEDASTLHNGLYYSGPSLVQRHSKFCFIYNFVLVSELLRDQLQLDSVTLIQTLVMIVGEVLVDDLECCTNCKCAVESQAEEVEATTERPI